MIIFHIFFPGRGGGGECVRPHPPPPPAERPFFKMWDGYPIAVCCYCEAPEIDGQN